MIHAVFFMHDDENELNFYTIHMIAHVPSSCDSELVFIV
jgi:hypothetical protein